MTTHNDSASIWSNDFKEDSHYFFDSLYAKYKKQVLIYVVQRVKSLEAAEEILYTIFLAAWEHKYNFYDEQAIKRYLKDQTNKAILVYLLRNSKDV
jgi:DNA-directed RNA polymerase specialized sigma24 family protein